NYNIVDIKGKGQFVGVNYYVNNPTPMWYGEGDDMIFIDGQELPTLNGTGTEDYFNTAFCPKEVFSNPYYGYPRVNSPDKTFETGWMGRTHLYRFHIVDPIYFDKSLRFTIENGRSNVLTLELASVAYWYQTEATKIPEIKAQADRKPRRILNPFEILRWRDEWRKSKGNGTKLWGWEK
ncbi:MAG: glycoside hydrolase family 172 protein, partial [Chryseolinea sp.]